MRYSQQEKYEIIRIVEDSEIGVNRTLLELGIHKSTFYNWYKKYLEKGYEGLAPAKRQQNTYWNKIPQEVKNKAVEMALELPEESPRQIACRMVDQQQYFISESSVYRILKEKGLITSPTFGLIKAADEFKDKTTRPNQMWQTDFTYLKVVGWGWYYLSTILDDYSRYIVHWELCSTMKATDVMNTVDRALEKANIAKHEKPRLLSDNGSCYISQDLKSYISDKVDHIRGKPLHPQTQGKIERYHRSMKNIIKLEHYYSPGELEYRIGEFVDYYNNRRYHESIQNMTPADVYFGRDKEILKRREKVRLKTMKMRRKNHFMQMSKL